MNDIEDLMHDGNWEDAQNLYKALNISANEFHRYLENEARNVLNWTLLGFYTREIFYPKK